MKYLKLGAGCDKLAKGSLRFTFDVGLESTKPASEKVRNVAVSTIIVLAFLLSVWGMHATDTPAQAHEVTFFQGGTR